MTRQHHVLVVAEAAHLTNLNILLVLHSILPNLVRELKRVHFCQEVILPLITLMLIAAHVVFSPEPFLITFGRHRALRASAHLVVITDGLELNVLVTHLQLRIS